MISKENFNHYIKEQRKYDEFLESTFSQLMDIWEHNPISDYRNTMIEHLTAAMANHNEDYYRRTFNLYPSSLIEEYLLFDSCFIPIDRKMGIRLISIDEVYDFLVYDTIPSREPEPLDTYIGGEPW